MLLLEKSVDPQIGTYTGDLDTKFLRNGNMLLLLANNLGPHITTSTETLEANAIRHGNSLPLLEKKLGTRTMKTMKGLLLPTRMIKIAKMSRLIQHCEK